MVSSMEQMHAIPSSSLTSAEAAPAAPAPAPAQAPQAEAATDSSDNLEPQAADTAPTALSEGERLFAEWLEVMRQKMNHDHLRVLELFREIDHNGDGTVTRDELASFLRQCGHPMAPTEVDAVMNVIDADHNDHVDYQEFAKRVHAKLQHATAAPAAAPATRVAADGADPSQAKAADAGVGSGAAAPRAGLDGADIYARWLEELNESCTQEQRNALLAALRAKDADNTGSLRRQPFRQVVRTTKPPDLNVRETNAMVSHLDSGNTMHIKYSELPVQWEA